MPFSSRRMSNLPEQGPRTPPGDRVQSMHQQPDSRSIIASVISDAAERRASKSHGVV